MYDVMDVFRTTVTCCMWLVRRGHEDLAIEMRDEHLREWDDRTGEVWDEACDDLADYIGRKGETPEISLAQLDKVRVRHG